MKTEQYSNYWLDDDLLADDELDSKEESQVLRLARLATARRAIGNFVSIMSGKNIPVKFSSGKSSYTDGKEVVISADDNPAKFDAMVGLALHEGSHILLSNFEFLEVLGKYKKYNGYTPQHWMGNTFKPDVFEHMFMPELAATLPTAPKFVERGEAAAQMIAYIWDIMNILEDRRIDQYVYRNAGGYRPYYRALYDKYFFTAEVGKNLKFNPKWREITIENYLDRMLYVFHPAAQPDAMPGLEALLKLVDIQNIDRVAPDNDPRVLENMPAWKTSCSFLDMPILWQEANKIFAHILRFVALAEQNKKEEVDGTPDGEGDGQSTGESKQSTPNLNPLLESLPNLDGAPSSPSEMTPTGVEPSPRKNPIKYNEPRAKNEKKELKKMMNGELSKKKVTKAELAAIDAFEESKADLVDIAGHGVPFGRCMVTRKMNESLFKQDWFIFSRYGWDSGRTCPYTEQAITAGKRIGQILVHRLQVRNDPLLTKQTRLPQGGLDRRLLAQLGMDITSVFQKSRVDQHRPAMLHLTIDASGSMSGKKWQKVRTIAVAIGYVASKMRNVDAVISIRGGSEIPVVHVVYDSRVDHFNKCLKFMRILEPAGGTPEGLCFKATLDLITECADTHDVYFINFSDGEPSFAYDKKSMPVKDKSDRDWFDYGGETAHKHTRAMINQIKEKGVKVLSYFISEDMGGNYTQYRTHYGKEAFKKMYGEDAVFVNVENATEVLRTLNKLLLTRGT